MDAQWQQFYWQHYLLQQQQQQHQQQQHAAHQSSAGHPYTPTGTYGPMTHAVRTQQARHTHPYTPSPSPSQPPHTHSPSTQHEFPPPPPPPLPTAAPVTPTAYSLSSDSTTGHCPVPQATYSRLLASHRHPLGLKFPARAPTLSHHSTHPMVQQRRKHFRQLHILPHTYHYHNFLSSNSVYIKLHFNTIEPQRCYHQHGHFYVGSTAIGIPHREHNRQAKLKQLQNNIPVSAELSLRYWHSHDNIHHFTTIRLSSHENYDQAWIHEHHYFSNWMPPLNWPFISQHLKLKAQGWQFTKHRAHFYSRLATHKRFFRRLRRRQQTIREAHLFTSTKHTSASFEAAKQLRSGRHTDLEVYAIRRMASNLEEPGRSRALHIINKALQYRNLTPPKPNIPLTVPFLAHDDFT